MTNTDLKKIIEQHFSSLISDEFKLKENILYQMPLSDFIIGFCFEKSRNEKDSAYVWSFIQPLYVPNDSIILSFGKRLENKLWTLKGNKVLKSEIDELVFLMRTEIDNFFIKTNSIHKFYNFFENECSNLRMIEALVYSAVYSKNEDSELILDNFINSLEHENLSIKWISDICENMKHLKLILTDKNELDNLFKKNIEYTKENIGLE
jgi:hypothetical protein